ncbi:MAG: hypothetical protein H6737_05410 [Alphaproteobacteria bacterium]|nr:hypothetical protein [Alphaproteobacteria bacterium]
MAVYAVLLGALVLSTAAALVWAPAAFVAMLIAIVGIALFLRSLVLAQPPVVVTRDGVHVGWPGGTRMPAGGLVVLRGHPADPWTELAYRGTPLVRDRDWTFEDGTRFGTRMADLVGGTLVDRRPEEAWRRWEHDPAFRLRYAFDKAVATSNAHFPEVHAVEPIQPYTEGDAGQVVYRVRASDAQGFAVTVDARGEVTGNAGGVALRDVRACALHARFGPYGKEVRVLALLETGLVVVAEARALDDSVVAELAWLADAIGRLAHAAERDRGEQSDVPESLRALRSAE